MLYKKLFLPGLPAITGMLYKATFPIESIQALRVLHPRALKPAP